MKTYLISVIVTSIVIALSELIIPQGKLKTVVNTALSIVLLIAMISPFADINVEDNLPVFNPNEKNEHYEIDENGYFDQRLKQYFERVYTEKLKANDLICEKVVVEISQSSIKKIQIFLSNLVIPNDNSHINNSVIANYVARVLGINKEKVEIYA